MLGGAFQTLAFGFNPPEAYDKLPHSIPKESLTARSWTMSQGNNSPEFPNPQSAIKKNLLHRFIIENPPLASLLIVGLILGATLMFFTPYFQLNDDTFKMMIAKGVGIADKPSEYICFSNIVFGFLLKGLYISFPTVPWFGLILILVQLLGAYAVLLVFQTGSSPWFKTMLYILGTAVIYVYCYKSIQYTLTAGLAAVGVVLLMGNLWKENHPRYFKLKLLLVGLLTVASILVRTSAFFLIVLSALPFALYLVWKQGLTPSRKFLLFFLGGLGVLASGLIVFDHIYSNHELNWKTFNLFDDQRVVLIAYRNPPNDMTVKAEFDSVGWTANDWAMFNGWYYMDEDIFSTEKMKKLNDAFAHYSLIGKWPENSFASMFGQPTNFTILLFFLAFLFFIPSKSFKFLLANLVFILLLLLYLNLTRSTPERLSLPPFFFLINAAVFFAVPKKLNPQGGNVPDNGWTIKAGLVLTFLLTFQTSYFLSKQYTTNHEWKYYEEVLDNSLANFHPQSNQLYAVWDSAFPYELLHALDSFEILRNFNTISLAYYQRTPFAQHYLAQFHVQHLFRDLVDRPDLFLVCSSYELQMYSTYMREHYQMEVQPELVFKSPFSFSIYRMHSMQAPPASISH